MSLTKDRESGTARSVGLKDPITRWLLMVVAVVSLIMLVGGFVRLSRAGLSIVEWDVITGVVPPIGAGAWEQAFAEYKQTPEYQIVNRGMSLGEFQRIFYYEWAHRFVARLGGMLAVLPLLWFLWKGHLTVRSSLRYWLIAALFGLNGAIGWLMVASGLHDVPAVSHIRLMIHLLTALLLLGVTLWLVLDRMQSAQPPSNVDQTPVSGTSRFLAWSLLTVVVIQFAYGALMAGLKAGHVSDTWPLMFGRLIPQGVLTTLEPWWTNYFQSLGSHWIHRWFAFVVAGIAVAVYVVVRRGLPSNRALRTATLWLLIVVAIQMVLGILTVLLGVPKWIALSHQAGGMLLFGLALLIVHRTRSASTATSPLHS